MGDKGCKPELTATSEGSLAQLCYQETICTTRRGLRLSPNTACLLQAVLQPRKKLTFTLPVPLSFLVFDRPWEGSNTWDAPSEMLRLSCSQLQNNFEKCQVISRSPIKCLQITKKHLPLPCFIQEEYNQTISTICEQESKACLQIERCSHSLHLSKEGGCLKYPSTWPRCDRTQQKPAPAQRGLNTLTLHRVLQPAPVFVLRQKSGTACNHKLNTS